MAKTNAIVDSVSEVSVMPERRAAGLGAPAPTFVAIRFRNGQSGFLDMSLPHSAVWADVLQSLRDTAQPAYVKIDAETRVINELLLPGSFTVQSVRPAADKDGIEVKLVISHARHFLRRSNPDYKELLRILQAAQKVGTTVLITEALDTHEIIDVRPLTKASKAGKARKGRRSSRR